MFTSSIENKKYLRGYMCNKEGRYIPIYIENTLENVASFVARAKNDVIITDTSDLLVIQSIGNYLDRIFNEDYRQSLLKVLIPMQMGEVEKPDIKFVYGEEEEECNEMTKEEFIQFVKDNTDYPLVG